MKSIVCRVSIVIVAMSCLVTMAHGEVLHAEPSGFVVRHEQRVVAPPETTWRMLVGHVGEWWNSDHTFSGNAANLYIEERPMGCFCERLGESDAVVHLMVTAVRQHSLLRLTGGLGPLGLMGTNGNMTFSLVNDGDATMIALEYRVGGYDPSGLDTIAPAVDATLGEQLARFVRFVESGSPEVDPVDDEQAQEPRVPEPPTLDPVTGDNT
ncbi:MAG: hypothetical protein AAF270_03790 [Pseudomonadota bacterium]